MGGKRYDLAALPPGMTRYPLCRRVGGLQAGLDGFGKSAHTGIQSSDGPAHSKSVYQQCYANLLQVSIYVTTYGKFCFGFLKKIYDLMWLDHKIFRIACGSCMYSWNVYEMRVQIAGVQHGIQYRVSYSVALRI